MAEADLKKGTTTPLPVDLTDKCTRLLGQICFANSPIDPRVIRALTFLTDKVDTSGSIDYFTSVALGNIPGAIKGTRVGRNTAIPSSLNIILSNSASVTNPIPIPAVPQQMQVVSSSANDTVAGIGIQQVAIEYVTIPPFSIKKTSYINMNGVAPVNTLATDIYRIDRFRANRVGAGLFAQGDILLQSVGGANTFEKIDIRDNVFRNAIHFVPKGFRSILTDLILGCVTAGGVQFGLTVFEEFVDTTNPNIFNPVLISQKEFEISGGAISVPLQQPITVSNTTGNTLGFVVIVIGRASNQLASGSFAYIDLPI